MNRLTPPPPAITAVGLFLTALLLRLLLAWQTGFDGLYGQDPFAYYSYSLELRQALAAGQLPPPFFWPIGYPLLVVAGTLLTGIRPLAGQLISITAGAALAPLTFLLVRCFTPERQAGALATGLLMASAAQLMLSSLSVMSDAAGLAWAVLSALLLVHYAQNLQWRWLALAALALGWAVLTRWVYALAVPAWVGATLLAWYRAKADRRTMLTHSLLAVAAGLLVLAPQFLSGLGSGELAHVGDLQVVGWNPANAFRSTLTNSDGIFIYERPVGLYYALPAIHPAFVFPLLAPFFLLGLGLILKKRPLSPAVLLLLGWPLTVYIFLAGIAWQNPRFSLALFPPLAVLTGLGFQTAWDRRLLKQSFQKGWRPALALWLALALSGSLAWSIRDISRFAAWNQAQIDLAHWTAAEVETNATVISLGLTLTLQHRTELTTRDIYLLTENDLLQLSSTPSPLYLMLDQANIESQWQGKSPEQNFRWFQKHTQLVEIGRSNAFTLWRVEQRPTPP